VHFTHQSSLSQVEKKQKATGQAAINLTMDTAELEQLQEAAKAAVQRKLAKAAAKKK
jgi:hypothetical protein